MTMDGKDKMLLETRGLRKYFKTRRGELHAVDDVNLTIERGKTLGIVGESGCGKSTLGRAILRLVEPTGGEVFFRGENIIEFDKSKLRGLRREAQIIFQDPYASLNPRKTVRQLIEDPLRVFGVKTSEREENLIRLMDDVGLATRFANSYPHELDGGRRQRIGVARALALDPEFIVCDEPVSALDVSMQAQILNLLNDLQEKRELTYLFITHDLSVVRHISNDIAVMYLGVVVELAPSKDMFENPLHPYTQELLNAVPIPDLQPEHRLVASIRGEVSDPINPPPGCRFAPRCKFVKDRCMGSDVPLRDMGEGHHVACVLYDNPSVQQLE